MNSSPTEEQPSKKKSLKLNFLFNLIGQILVLVIPLATAPYLARVLGVDINGRISFANSIISYFTLASSFGFTTYGQREIAKYQNDKEKRSQVYWEIFTIRTLFTLVSLGVLLGLIFGNVFGEKYRTFLLIQTITVFTCCIDPSFYYQGMEEFKLIAIRTIVVRLIGMCLVFIFVKTQDDAWLYVLCNAGANLLAGFAMWPLIFKQTRRIKIKDLHIWRHLGPAFLIFLPNLAVTIYSVLDKTMIGVLAENADYENGCYEKAYQLNSIMLILVTILSSVMAPRNAHDYAIGDKESFDAHVKFNINYVWMMGLPLIFGCSILCHSLSFWFLGDEYDEVPLLLQVMSVRFVASGLGVVVGDLIFIPRGKEKYSTIATAGGAVVNFVLNIFFIKWWGATGAAITTAFTEVLVTSISIIIALKQKYLSWQTILCGLPKKLIAAAIMFVPVFFMNRYLEYNVGTFLLITATGGIVYFAMLLVLQDAFFLGIVRKITVVIKSKFKKKERPSNED